MTDKEIMLGIKYCHDKEAGCDYCPYAIYLAKDCDTNLMKDALDLIDRQQAENEMLKAENEKAKNYLAKCFDKYEKTKIAKESLENTVYTARAEAIKEFAEKLKAEHSTPDILMPFNWISIEDTALDQLVAEMVGADNG